MNMLQRAASHPGFQRYFKNTGWLFTARIIGYAISFLMVAYVARYLGPENLGKLSFAQSFVAIFSVFASLGMDSILIRDLVADPEHEQSILGTAFTLKLICGLITLLATIAVALLTNSDPILIVLISIISLTLIIQPFGVISHLITAKVLSKYYAYITIFLSLLIASLKLIIIAFHQGIIYFAAIFVVETTVYSIYYIIIYKKIFGSSVLQWSFNSTIAKQILKSSWPFLLASLSAYIYGRIDQVMIQYIKGSFSVGIYDAAVKLTEVLGFLPVIIIGSLFPAIVSARQADTSLYYRRLRYLLLFITGISLLISIGVFICAPLIIRIVFGTAFTATVPILRLYIWSGMASAIGSIVQQYLIAENFGKKYFIISAIGALMNILLNLFLIPRYNTAGAAIATLISYSFVPLSIILFSKPRQDWLIVLGLRT